MSAKLLRLVAEHGENMREDAGVRPAGNAPPAVSKLDGRTRVQDVFDLDIDRVVADEQTRKIFDEAELKQLADSIRDEGQLTPGNVRWDDERKVYVIIAGERRWRACKMAGKKTFRATIADDGVSAAQIRKNQLIENLMRADLRPVEEARAFADTMKEQGWDGKTLAEQLHLSPARVSRALALLKLPEEEQRRIDAGEVSRADALKLVTRDLGRGRAKKPGKSGEVKRREFRLSDGVTVTVTHRKVVTDAAAIAALGEVLDQLGGGGKQKAG
ncbi:MAG: parB 4 [Gemmataceae bacterium]|nr:parB 4 [Gemmataceae bacterium]